MADATQNEESPLTLYVSYEYLPALQQAALVASLGNIYDVLLWHAHSPGGIVFAPQPWERSPVPRLILGPPLCITSVETGDSIIFRFGVKGQLLPHLQFHAGDLEVMVPRWTAAVVLVGAAVTVGLHAYSEFLNVQKTSLEIEKLHQEIEQFELDRADRDPRFQIHLQEFRLVVAAPNIRHATINGVPVDRAGLMPKSS